MTQNLSGTDPKALVDNFDFAYPPHIPCSLCFQPTPAFIRIIVMGKEIGHEGKVLIQKWQISLPRILR